MEQLGTSNTGNDSTSYINNNIFGVKRKIEYFDGRDPLKYNEFKIRIIDCVRKVKYTPEGDVSMRSRRTDQMSGLSCRSQNIHNNEAEPIAEKQIWNMKKKTSLRMT